MRTFFYKLIVMEEENNKSNSRFDTFFDKLSMIHWHLSDKKKIDEQVGLRVWNRLEQRIQGKRILFSPINKTIFTFVAMIVIVAIFTIPSLMKNQSILESDLITLEYIEPASLMLPDGTQVWVHPYTTIKYKSDFLVRDIWIEGQALFAVTQDVEKTFRVYTADNTHVEVKGTTFSVENDSIMQTVLLYSGEVDFVLNDFHQTVALYPSQKIEYNQSTSALSKKDVNIPQIEDGFFKFKDVALVDLIQQIEEVYSCDIQIGKHVSLDNRFTGSIKCNENLANTLDKITYTFNLSYDQIENVKQVFIY